MTSQHEFGFVFVAGLEEALEVLSHTQGEPAVVVAPLLEAKGSTVGMANCCCVAGVRSTWLGFVLFGLEPQVCVDVEDVLL